MFVYLEISTHGKVISSIPVDLGKKSIFTFGRSDKNDFVLRPPENSMSLSRTHATLQKENSDWILYSGSPGNPAKNFLIDSLGKRIEDRAKLQEGNVTLFPDDNYKIILKVTKNAVNCEVTDAEYRDTKSSGISGDIDYLRESMDKISNEFSALKETIKRQEIINKRQNKYLLLLGIICAITLIIYVISKENSELLQKQMGGIIALSTAVMGIYALLTKDQK